MHYELSKRDKKIARACIDKGLEAQFREALEELEGIITDWRAGKFAGHKEAYHRLYKTLEKKDRMISVRYDGLTGSRWLITVVGILRDGYISENDIKYFSDETKSRIRILKGV